MILLTIQADFSYYFIDTKHHYLEYEKPIYLNNGEGKILF